MKKAFIFLCLAAGLLSCAKEIAPQEETKGVPMTFEFSVDGQTKASKTAWTDNDVIYVFFKGLETKFLMLTYDSATRKWTPSPYGGPTDEDFSALTEHTLTAVHYPRPVYVTYDGVKGFFKISTDGAGGFCYNYYLFQEDNAYEVEGTTVTARIALEKPADVVQFHVPCNTTEVGGTFGCSLIQPVACAGVGVDGKIVEKELQAGARLNGISDADGLLFAGRLTNPGTASDYTFTFATDNEIYTLLRENKTLEPGKQYNYPALTVIGPDDWNKTDVEDLYVDLGLTSGLKWAKCNLGAATETDYGDYFAWGELQPKSNYDWSTYAWMQEGQSDWNYITKYTVADGQTEGIWYDGETFIGDGKTSFQDYDNVDDAAYAALGGKFRMPTDADWAELLKECPNPVRKTTEDGYAQNGFLFTGPNHNTLFLPATGYRYGTGFGDTGFDGYYWSSSLYEYSSDYAMRVNIYSGRGSIERCRGYAVRPVCD